MKKQHRYRRRGPQTTTPTIEWLEQRRLLSGYALKEIAAFPNSTEGDGSSAMLLDSSGNLYSAVTGNAIIEIPRGSSTIVTLARFNGTNGESPASLIMDSSGNMFGTTEFGGAYNQPEGYGTIFELPDGRSTITDLASFNNTDGGNPYRNLLMDSNGNLYGTTIGGGPYDDGTVFEFVRATSSIRTVAAFNSTDGYRPFEVCMDSNGDLFGVTPPNGTSNYGTIFEIAESSSSITTLVTFSTGNSSNPSDDGPASSIVLDSSGDLFGTGQGGPYSDGTIFEIPAGTSTLTTIAVFNNSNGALPTGLVRDSAGDLYGVATEGGDSQNDGTIFEVAAGSSAITTLAFFNQSNGYQPLNLTMDPAGNFYGATTGITVGDFFELSPTTPPAASVAAPDVIAAGAAATIQVTYADTESPIDTTTIAASNLTATGPAGSLPVSLQGVTGSGNTVTATYAATPVGGWTAADNGNYSVSVLSGTVKDLAGNAVAMTTGSFSVNVPTTTTDTQPPVATISAPDVTAASATSESVTVVYTDNVAVSAASIATGNLAISGPAGNLMVTDVSLSPTSDAATITATYTIAAPSGGWSSADNGTYTISLLVSQVTDTSGNVAAAQQASFLVSIPTLPPPTPIGTAVGGKRPLVFDAGSVKLSAIGGSVAVDQLGDDFDLVLTPNRVGGAMSVSIRGAALSLGDVTTASALRLTNFSAPSASLAGAMTLNGAIGTIKLSNIAGKLVASSIANLSANALTGAVTTQGAIGAVRIGSVTGILAAGTSIHSLTAASVSNADVLAGAYLGADATLYGAGDIYGAGSIGSLVLGSIANSFIGAGVNPVDGLFGNGNDAAESGVDKIVAFKTKAAIGAGVTIEAAGFPKKVHIPGVTAPTSPVFTLLS